LFRQRVANNKVDLRYNFIKTNYFIDIQLSKDDYDKCFLFATKWAPTSIKHYQKRNQFDREKIISDQTIGKFAELGVYKLFTENMKLECSNPDFNIYENKCKSFDPDLVVLDYKIHVKSCRINTWDSWTLQYSGSGSGHKDKVLYDGEPNNFIALCFVDTRNLLVKLAGIMDTNYCIQNGLYKLPVIENLREYKRALYYKDIEKLERGTLWSFVTQAAKAGLLNRS
jgi:hypothetical protein